jgi:hypothetical protein
MPTTQQIEHLRSTWRMLPLHPQPQWLESLSSYMIRLAEANNLKSINELATLAGMEREWYSMGIIADYFTPSSPWLAYMAGCTPTILRNTTFYHLAHHFACPGPHLRQMRKFLQGSIASSLRYCPLCLADMPYYRLYWRFLAIAGCDIHGCSLASECGHCGAPLPFLPRIPRLAFCATCQRDLRTCRTPPLPQQAGMRLQKRTRDLELLLMPTEWVPEIPRALLQGSGFIFLRQRKHLSVAEMAHLIERDEQVIQEIEEGDWSRKATFADYWQYIEILDSSLAEVIEVAKIMRSRDYEMPSRHEEREHPQETMDPIRPLRRKNRVSSSKSQ